MPLRKTLMRAMLWSLGFAAVTGVLAVLFQGGDLVWRVVGTGLVTAVACGLMLPVSSMIDREASRPAGLLGMAAVVIEYTLALVLIWEVPRNLFGLSLDEEFAVTTVLFGLAAPASMGFLRLLSMPRGRPAGRFGLAAAGVLFVVCMIAVWKPRNADEWWQSAGVGLLVSVLALVALSGWGAGLGARWRIAGLAGGGIACVLWLLDIWIGTGSDLGFVIFCLSISLAAVVAHANACMLCTLSPGQRWVRIAALAAAVTSAVLVDVIAIDDELSLGRVDEDVLGRLAAAGGIVAGCATLSLLVLARLGRRVDYRPMSVDELTITLVCPRCRRKQQLAPGAGACRICRLRIEIRIEEPRCPGCDYLLYQLTGDRCPECGAMIEGARSLDSMDHA